MIFKLKDVKDIFIRIKQYRENQPLAFIMIIAIILRFIAVIFAKGFGMHDDHFLYIEVPQSWVDGLDYNKWLPWSEGNTGASGHSFVYPGFNFLVLWFFKFIGINSPEIKMLLIRLIHALLSLFVVSISYKISKKIANEKTAFYVALLIAIYWFMPWLSVRNLVEIVCIPFLFLSIWQLYKTQEDTDLNEFILVFISGIWSGVAFSIRYQVSFFILGLGFAILFKKGFKKALLFTLGFLTVAVVSQGIIDYFIWGKPFTEFSEYVRYNIYHRGDYPNGPWYNYILLVSGILIPPLSILIAIGFFKSWRNNLLIFLPVFFFFAFHSYFPNKQERFILTVVPFIILLGIAGWNEIIEKNNKKFYKKLTIISIWIFLIINTIALIFVTPMYSKRSRIESMVYLSKYQNINSLLIESSNESSSQYMPLFYLNQWPQYHVATSDKPVNSEQIPWEEGSKPDFVLFLEEKGLESRLENISLVLPNLTYETTIKPGFIDNLLHTINPHNRNYIITIYRNTVTQPNKVR